MQRLGGIDLPFHNSMPNLEYLRAEIVQWVAKSKRPFKVISDQGFKSLMKTSRPEYRLLSPQTVSRDVKHVFVNVRKRIAKMLQVRSTYQNTWCKNWYLVNRSMTALLISLRMLGPHRIVERLLQWPRISSIKVSPYPYYLISSRSLARILESILLLHSPKF